MENLLNSIFPPKCLFCSSVGSVFCRSCLEKCNILEKPLFFLTSRDRKSRISIYSCFEYEGLVRACIKMAKFNSKQFSAFKMLTLFGLKYLHNLLPELFKMKGDFLIVPIPVSREKLASRGFNQADLIARILSKEFGLRHDPKLLLRKKDTDFQFTHGREDRFKNVRGAFEVRELLEHKTIILVDDICTSGATFLEAYKTLAEKGYKRIICFSLSKA